MEYFPAFLKLDARDCLLVGAGEVGARKARLLLSAGARLTVVAPSCGTELRGELANDQVRFVQREFRPTDVIGQWLVVGATNDPQVQALVKQSADAEGIFCNCVDEVANSSFINPAIVDRSPVIVAISSAGAAPVLVRKIRAQLEVLLPASLGQLAELARSWRTKVSKSIEDVFGRRRFWERVFEGPVVSAIRDGGAAAGHQAIAKMLRQADRADEQQGQAWLVGAGPGDPELLTLQAVQVLQSADVILHDRLVSQAVLNMARRDVSRISVGKKPGSKKNSQAETNALLVSLVAAGKRVCRLKGGDPFIFGRGGEEAEALSAAKLPYQVVPGITAAVACAAYAGIPLTHRDTSQSVVLLAGHGKDSVDSLDWPSLARDRQTLAVYMAVQQFEQLMNKLIEHGRSADTPVAIIENGTTPEQRVFRGSLGQLTLLAQAHQIAAPAMLIIGAVAKFGQHKTPNNKDREWTTRGIRDDLRQYSANDR